MDADGQNVRALTDTTENFKAGPGGRRIAEKVLGVTAWQQEASNYNFSRWAAAQYGVGLRSGEPLDDSVAISPDGQRVAYMDKVPGRMTPGIFVSRLDGTEQRLLVQLDSWSAGPAAVEFGWGLAGIPRGGHGRPASGRYPGAGQRENLPGGTAARSERRGSRLGEIR